MQVKHELLSFDATNWSVEVRFFADELDRDFVFNLDVPFENGAFVGEEQFAAYVALMTPTQQFERALAIKNTAVPEYLAALPVVVTSSAEVNEIEATVL